jgi:citrate lyase subunit beta/citryl-CoA lyase
MSDRSYLFVPANRAERCEKALRTEADAVIIDLEDAVAPADAPSRVRVRVNAACTGWFDDDVRLCGHPTSRGAVLDRLDAMG